MNINSVVLYVVVYRLVQPEFVLLYVISRSSIMQSIKFLVIKLVWQIHQITRICLHAYMSDKLINFASAGGNSPLNGFDDKMLKNNNNNVNAVIENEKHSSRIEFPTTNCKWNGWEITYSFCNLTNFPISGGMRPEKRFPSMLL